jgi:hypothetical protein
LFGRSYRCIQLQHLKTFLDYAERGAIALSAESQLYRRFRFSLRQGGCRATGTTRVDGGRISGLRIDLGVDPDLGSAYLAGIECNGATYHSSATSRDRDKLREQVLQGPRIGEPSSSNRGVFPEPSRHLDAEALM